MTLIVYFCFQFPCHRSNVGYVELRPPVGRWCHRCDVAEALPAVAGGSRVDDVVKHEVNSVILL